jgi:hypothetical protein
VPVVVNRRLSCGVFQLRQAPVMIRQLSLLIAAKLAQRIRHGRRQHPLYGTGTPGQGAGIEPLSLLGGRQIAGYAIA